MQSRGLPEDGRARMHRWHIRRRSGGEGPVGLSVGFAIRALAVGAITLMLSCGDGAVEPAPPPPAPVATTVAVSPASATLTALEETTRFTAEVRDQNGQVMAGAAVAWASSDASVAAVDASGQVTSAGNGAATITATAGSVSGTAAVTVAQAEITVENPDRAALLALYEATDGPNWVNNENWLTDAPLGEWYGVGTDASGRVVSLEFLHWDENGYPVFFGLAGPIPPQLGNLTNLTRLYLGTNSLRGPIPPELGNLTNLTRLNLGNNSLSGPIPSELGNLTNLTWLTLGNNSLSGPIPSELGNLANLTRLNLEENRLSGAIPAALADLTSLELLFLHKNNLSGRIPSELQNLSNLTRLWLTENELTGTIPPELGNLVNLRSLILHYNNLTGPIPQQLGNLSRLRILGVAANDLNGPVPPELGNLRSLEILSVGANNLSGSIPPELGNLRSLVILALGDNQLTGPIPPELGNLTELEILGLSKNRLTGSLPLSFTGLKKLGLMGCSGSDSGACIPRTDEFRAWLREVEARGNHQIPVDMPFCDEIDAAALARLYRAAKGSEWRRSEGWLEDESLDRWYGVRTDSIGRVAGIDLSGNGLSGSLPEAVGHLTSMKELRIHDNPLIGRLPSSLVDVPLEALDYTGTSLCAPTGTGFQDWLNAIPRHGGTGMQCPPLTDREILERFSTDVGGISQWSPTDLADWYGVETDAAGRVVALRLPYLNLSGSLPVEFAQLSKLRVLDLRGNAFRGRIPPELGGLDRLERLDLAGNRLSGGIPPELGRLSGLRDLSLRENEFSGPIPPELGELSGLQRLDLAWNHLSGEIPPELAEPLNIEGLDLGGNSLSGAVPPELGDLGHMTVLRVANNQLGGSIPSTFGRLAAARIIDLSSNQFDGAIPSQLGELSDLLELNLSDNRLTGPIPAELHALANLRALRLSGNHLTGSIPAGLGDLANLAMLDLGDNQFTGSIPSQLGSLSDVTTLNLGGNELTGPLPAELGRATMLEDLDLRSNALTGPLPPGFGNLTQLGSLMLADNPGLAGPLPPGIVALDRLERFMAGGTELCRPADVRFDTWFRSIANRRVASCRDGAAAYLTQAVQSWDDPVPLLAGRPALLRVFVTAPNGGGATMPSVRARFYVDGNERHALDIAAGAQTIPSEIVEGDLALSANAEVPGSVVVPGLEMVIEVDPDGTLDPALHVTKRIPETGRLAVDVRRVPPFSLTLIPFLSDTETDSSIVETVAAMAADPDGHELLRGARSMLPMTGLDVTGREPVVSSWTDAARLLGQIHAMRLMEGASGHWMGLVGHGRPRGIAGVGGWSSVSFVDARIIAHELGHNLSLSHAPCGTWSDSNDPWFPHANGAIGAWGYDFEQGTLVPPHSSDVMSYCQHIGYWISDFFFNKALANRLASADAEVVAATHATRTLLLWGGRDEDGVPYLDPAFVVDAVPSVPAAGGKYTIGGTTADGTPVFSIPFDMPRIGDPEGEETSFVFALPVQARWADLARITLSGPGGSAVLDEMTDQPMAILRDPRTGQVRGFLRDPAAPTQTAADAAGQGGGPGLEVLFSRGIPSAEAWRR